MTEAEWLTATDPTPILEFLLGRAGDRKLRLFCVACSRTLGDTNPRILVAFERHADGTETEEDEQLLGNDWTPAWESARLSLGYTGDGRLDCDLLRDIFGNPFRPVAFDPRWRSESVVALAEGIYAERAFDRMPILADALEEAACDHADLLAHCRGDGRHVRGCWVVDLVLGKE